MSIPGQSVLTAKSLKAASIGGGFLRRWRLPLIFVPTYVLLSVFVLLSFLQVSRLGDRYYGHRVQFEATVEGTAWRPFVQRLLIPKTIFLITQVTPESWQQAVNQSVNAYFDSPQSEHVRRIMPALDAVFHHTPNIYARVVATFLIWGSLLGYAFVMHRLAQNLFPNAPAISWFSPIFALLSVISFNQKMQYLYDIPMMLLMALCCWCMVNRRFALYLGMFILATLNKESSIFIVLYFACWFFRRMDIRAYTALLLAQGGIYLIIRILVATAYMNNPGGMIDVHLANIFHGELFRTYPIWDIALKFLLLTYAWPEKPAFLKCGLWPLLGMSIAYSIFGMPKEYRVFMDVMPPLILLGTHTLIAAAQLNHSKFFLSERHVHP